MDFLLIPLALAAGYVLSSLRVLNQYERGVVFFLGKFTGTRGPGLLFVPTGLARMKRVSMRIVALDVPPQEVITRDNISVTVNAVLYFRVSDPALAILEVQDYLHATGQLAQTTLLSVLGQVELDELLADRRKVNDLLRQIIDERTDFWGVEISAVEVKDVQLPEAMRRAIARQAEAERERRAKVINAQGELQASETLAEAARVMATQPASLQLRYLQTVTEIAAENNSTTIFPVPIDMLNAFVRRMAEPAAVGAEGAGTPPAVPASTPADESAPPAPARLPAPNGADLLPQIRIDAAKVPASDAGTERKVV
ncbi:MAG: flotillin band 7 stomatin-like domain protein [Geminicoccaceae bacterium]|jgi:regulator of protease activity HflC (stomatin/prohibitin superfamily)|nr:flotillin band 7 stomatin-like domain protein [Geminicoccaceae bacterium]